MELDMCSENVSQLSSTVDVLSTNWTIPDLKEDFDALISRFEMIKVTISEVKQALPFMHDCFGYQATLLEVLTWVQEIIALLELDYAFENQEEIQEELEKHKVAKAIILKLDYSFYFAIVQKCF